MRYEVSSALRASCTCTSAILLRAGAVVCASCGAPVLAGEVGEFSTLRLPPDAKNASAFNRACRRGDVVGAEKRGRVWTCSAEAWRARKAAPAPTIAKRKTLASTSTVSVALLERLGARRAS
jgi:hypothetical protein